jgi:predicted CXXCH cytochrome family protein
MKSGAKSAVWIAFLFYFVRSLWPAGEGSVVNSPHNLSVSGPGPVKSVQAEEVCSFCHVPHHATAVPLLNRPLSEAAYLTYKSATAKALPGQPTGASKLCLSCHDGTIALGRLTSQKELVMISGGEHPRGRKNLGTDLSDDHPVSMAYNQALAANPHRYRALPMQSGRSLLDENNQVQCTSCHDPHNNQHGKFLVMENREGRLCMECHTIQEWAYSSHNLSTARWKGAGRNPWPYTPYDDVHNNACANCHTMHDAGGKEHLLYYELEADNCYSCHNGSVAAHDIRGDFEQPFRHRVEAAKGGRARPLGRDFDVSHVGCADCHNAHAANDAQSVKPRISGALMDVSGVSASGGIVQRSEFEYEVCFKCHSGLSDRSITRPIRRLATLSSLREKFGPSAVSFHPVEVVGRNPDVPSLLAPWNETSLVSCMDCHGNDSDVRTGPARIHAPHGSKYRYLLVRRYETGDLISESEQVYALCYKCHDRLNLLSDQTFTLHNKHIVVQRTPCSVCHDSHGVSRSEGTPLHNAHLINFDVTVVRPDPVTGRQEYVSEGYRKGTCFLSCHGEAHSPHSY